MYRNYNWIDDHLAIGGLIDEPDELPFEAILSLETFAPLAVRDLVRLGRTEYCWLPLGDNYFHPWTEVLYSFDSAADLIHTWLEQDRRVLVHCYNGISRSATAVIWYLIRCRGYHWEGALGQVRRCRPWVDPDIRLEIPLRLRADPALGAAWLEERLIAYCQDQLRLTGILLDWQDIRRELEEHQTLPRRFGMA